MFDVQRFLEARVGAHVGRLGIRYHAHGADWVELAMPYDAGLAGDLATGVLASGPIVAMMDVATSLAIWVREDRFIPQATLDLRVDYLRPAVVGKTLYGRGECYRVTPSLAFVRGQAHDGDPDDGIAHVAGTFMFMDAWR